MKLSHFQTIKNSFNKIFVTGELLQRISQQKHIDTIACLTALTCTDPNIFERQGIYVNYETVCNDPELTNRNGDLVAVYIGLYGVGIVAQYIASEDVWHECQSHGNFGNNFASGGTWTVTQKHKKRVQTSTTNC